MDKIKTKDGRTLNIVTNYTGEQYVLQGFVVGGNFLIPFVPHWNGGTSLNYWEHHYAKRETWIPMSDIDFNEWNITKEQYDAYLSKQKESHSEILEKYHNSF